MHRYALMAVAAIFAIVGLQGLLVPAFFVEPLDIQLTSPASFAEIRAGYGGLFLGAAWLAWRGAQDPAVRPIATRFAAIVLGVFSAARWASLLVDGVPNAFSIGLLSLETAGFIVALILLRRAPAR